LTDHIVKRLPDSRLAVASPDIGGVKRAQLFRELLEARTARPVELAFFEKRRVQGVVSGHALVGEVKERTVIIIDDLCATGNTLMRAAQTAHHAGAAAVYTAVTHVPHMPGLAALLADPNITGCITTDSVGFAPVTPPAEARKLTVLSIVPLFGQAVARMLARKPLAPLLESWPVVGG
jgi:ribose-phosphate pyrophosphokinase